MIEQLINSPEILTVAMIGSLLIGFLLGYPIAIVIGGTGLIFGYMMWGGKIALSLISQRIYVFTLGYTFLAVPLFIFMGDILEKSGITEELYKTLQLWIGKIKGGLAIITIILGTILAACVGVIGASVSMLALIAIPVMLNRGYDKSLACGTVCAGGTLGILIPPSVMLVVYGPMANISVGKLFAGAVGPGLLLSLLYSSYIGIRCAVRPELGPPATYSEKIPLSIKIKKLFITVVPVTILILSVLGSIFLGIAAPTEAASVGAFVAMLLSAYYRKLNWKVIKGSMITTLRLTSMIMLIAVMSNAFVGVFMRAGCGDVIKNIVLSAPGGKWGGFSLIMFIVFILGFFLDWWGIVFVIVPIISPIVSDLGFDPVWFAIMVCVMLQTAFLTPPMAAAIFYLKGSIPKEFGVTMSDIIQGVIPFILLIVACILLCIFFPKIILWLPSLMIK